MIAKRPAADRGHFDHGWLKTWHSFSFADYHDAAEMGWSRLRVINDDIVEADAGFGRHGHRDMEIVTYMLAGTLKHGDSMRNATALARPEVQRMSAGRGVMHSEFNGSASERAHLLQIVRGEIALSGQPFATGDGAKMENESGLAFAARGAAEVLLFDLP